MSLLDLFLKKKGIKGYEELTAEERKIFDVWNKELEGKPVTTEDLAKFLKEQQIIVISEFEDFQNPPNKDLFLKVYSRLCRQLISYIEKPEKVKTLREEAIKEQLNGVPRVH